MATKFPIKGGVLQGDLDADGWTILNLDLTGLGLTKASVGLGNVDNTSDANKPVSTATAVALALKENFIVAGTTAQYRRGDKTWQTLGALGLQGGNTTLPELSAIGANTLGFASIASRRSDYGSSFAETSLRHYGTAYVGNVIPGVLAANAGFLLFQNTAAAVIGTNGPSPLIFSYNNARRMRLMQGLNVGGDGDPGNGCITAYDTITAGHLLGSDLNLSGAPGNGHAIIGGHMSINGTGGDGWILLAAQTSLPPVGGARLFATSVGRVGMMTGGTFGMSFAGDNLTASRIYDFPDVAGTVVTNTAAPANAGSTGKVGQVAIVSGFLYACVAANTWQRVAIATW